MSKPNQSNPVDITAISNLRNLNGSDILMALHMITYGIVTAVVLFLSLEYASGYKVMMVPTDPMILEAIRKIVP